MTVRVVGFRQNFLAACFCALLSVSVGFADQGLADQVVVKKAERKLFLMNGDEILREFDIALGLVPEGHKVQEGDFRTPEGEYQLTRRRINSDFFMAIQVSYPDRQDLARARAKGLRAGNNIMIHGQPTVPKRLPAYYEKYDWTDGCIAVSNSAMVDIWQLTTENTPITILP